MDILHLCFYLILMFVISASYIFPITSFYKKQNLQFKFWVVFAIVVPALGLCLSYYFYDEFYKMSREYGFRRIFLLIVFANLQFLLMVYFALNLESIIIYWKRNIIGATILYILIALSIFFTLDYIYNTFIKP